MAYYCPLASGPVEDLEGHRGSSASLHNPLLVRVESWSFRPRESCVAITSLLLREEGVSLSLGKHHIRIKHSGWRGAWQGAAGSWVGLAQPGLGRPLDVHFEAQECEQR